MNDSDSTQNEQSNKGIEVFLRIRPSSNPSGYFSQDEIDETQFIFQLPKHSIEKGNREGRGGRGSKKNDVLVTSTIDDNGNPIANNTRTRYGFKFNGILDDKASQDDVFRTIGAPAVRNVLDGFNSTVFAYGQTGSGKTFTITGGPERYADRGVIPRAISMLFQSLQNINNVTFSCYVSYFELYNESGYDLLAHVDNQNGYNDNVEISKLDDLPKVTMLEDEDGNYHFRNLSVNQVSTEEEALNLLFIGDTNRAIGETQMNQSSSRSHCIFTIMVEMRKGGSDTVIRSKLNLVDLAGSERVHKTNSSGQTLKEAQYINSSLFFLEMVIVALHERTKRGKEHVHIPYRNSMMTSVLRDSLGGNCKTIMIATISPEAGQTDESISTCHFAQRVALVKNNAFVNEELEPEFVIKRLKAEVKRLREEVKFLKGENGEEDGLTLEQNTELKDIVTKYLFDNIDGKDLNIGKITLSKIQATFCHFRTIFNEMDNKKSEKVSHMPSTVDTISENEFNAKDQYIQSLKQTIRQRDDEIKLLVKMVKNCDNQRELVSKDNRTNAGSNDQLGCFQNEEIKSDEGEMEFVQEEKVCGVQYCKDNNILNDPSKAFAWFKERYPGGAIDEENKLSLQSRFIEAKKVGENLKAARVKIQQHKHLIEKARLDFAIDGIVKEGEVGPKCNPIESQSRVQIDKNKNIYQSAFQKLKGLKSEIEHIKILMERRQIKLQKDFDNWYDKMCQEDKITIMKSSQAPESIHLKKQPKKDDDQVHFKLPLTARLTGNKETDDDIIAFYKAKEALHSRNKLRETMN